MSLEIKILEMIVNVISGVKRLLGSSEVRVEGERAEVGSDGRVGGKRQEKFAVTDVRLGASRRGVRVVESIEAENAEEEEEKSANRWRRLRSGGE